MAHTLRVVHSAIAHQLPVSIRIGVCEGLDSPEHGVIHLHWRDSVWQIQLARGDFHVLVPRPIFERYYDAHTGGFGGPCAFHPHEFGVYATPAGFVYITKDAAKAVRFLECLATIAKVEDDERPAHRRRPREADDDGPDGFKFRRF